MDPRSRTILIGLLSLAAVLAIYLLYSQLSKAPQIDIDIGAKSIDTAADSNVGDFDSEIGKIGDIGIVGLTKPVFRHLKNGRVDRELGFEELLHEVKGEWEVEKPYINIYQPNFNCSVTADRGKIQIEIAGGGPSPKDATFTGNVVVHILPESGSDIKESFIYLNDLIFISEKSLLSTAGPVRFVSQDAQMLGTGLEMIYNDQLERMELFRIVHLAALHLKSSWPALFSQTTQDNSRQAKPAIATDSQKQDEMPATSERAAEQGQGEYYKCVLSKNVVIDAPDQLVFAKDRISINNIFWSRASNGEPNESIRQAQDMLKTTGKDGEVHNATASKDSGLSKSAQTSRDTIVTCDNGIFVFPTNSTIIQNDFLQPAIERTGSAAKPSRDSNDSEGRTIFITERIDYNVLTNNTDANGPLELTFYVNDIAEARLPRVSNEEESPSEGWYGGQAESRETLVPINITARKKARFLSATKQITFEGDCVCTMNRTEPNNIQQKFTLSAPTLTANLTTVNTDTKSRIEHLTADGDVVKLQRVKTTKGKLLSGVELKCCKINYNTGQELFIATGPGQIGLNNSNVSEPNEQAGRFSLRRPCYALLRDFATLKYYIKDNRIIADAEPGRTLQIDYFPIVESSYGQDVTATAAHAEVGLAQTADGQNELSMLVASGGITYKEDKGNELLGSKLFYDREKSLLKIEGDEAAPCYFNGALVEKISYDPKTGKFEVPLAGPGALQIK
jgi:hypothetical protein